MAKDTRIDRLFSALGILSRSECKKAIKRGDIAVNGAVCSSPEEKIDRSRDMVTLSGRTVDIRPLVYYMMHKPAGVITAADDKKAVTVMDYIEDRRTDLAPVGRLDKDTTGFLLITNDGQLNHRLLSPRYHVPKTYRAVIDGILSESDIRLLERGINIGDEKPALPAQVAVLDQSRPQTVLLTITEGRFHQVKRMFQALEMPVLTLHRQSFGPLELDPALSEGEYRELTEKETAALKQAAISES